MQPLHRFLCLVFFSVTLGIIVWQALAIRKDSTLVRSALKPIPLNALLHDSPPPETIPGISDSLQLVLNGDPTAATEEERWRPLPLSDPENHAFYRTYLLKIETIPDDFDETVQRLAPENGWFDLWKANQHGKDSFSKERRSGKERKKAKKEGKRILPIYEITDSTRFQEALNFLHQAAAKPDFDPYDFAIGEMITKEIPPLSDFFSTYLGSLHQQVILGKLPLAIVPSKNACDLLCAGLMDAAKRKSRKEFEKLEKTTLLLRDRMLNDSHSLVGLLVAQAVYSQTSQALAEAATRLKLPKKSTLYAQQSDAMVKRLNDIKARNLTRQEELVRYHGGITSLWLATSARFSKPTLLTEDVLEPNRRAEQAFFSGAFVLKLSLAFLILAAVSWSYQFMASSEDRARAARPPLTQLLLTGALLPIVLFCGIRYLTPWGGLEYGPQVLSFLNYYLPFSGLGLFLVSSAVVTARSMHSADDKASEYQWFFFSLALASLFFAGNLSKSPGPFQPVYVALGFQAIILLWLLFIGFRSFSKKSPHLRRRAGMSRSLTVVFLATACLLAASSLAFRSEENYWMTHSADFLPDGIHPTKFEGDLTRLNLEEYRNFLSDLSSIGKEQD